MGASRSPRLESAPGDPVASRDARIAELTAALEKATARIAELEELAHVDELTGVLNRRGFLREMARAASYTQRYQVPIVLALMDLDGFKPVNDRLGHPAGDAVLSHIAGVLAQHLRASDAIARLGGDEFAILLWHADETVGTEKMRNLQALVAGHPVLWKGVPIPIEMSVGLVALSAGEPIETALQQADRRLYQAKESRHGGLARISPFRR